jgi:hypothetical protein
MSKDYEGSKNWGRSLWLIKGEIVALGKSDKITPEYKINMGV